MRRKYSWLEIGEALIEWFFIVTFGGLVMLLAYKIHLGFLIGLVPIVGLILMRIDIDQ